MVLDQKIFIPCGRSLKVLKGWFGGKVQVAKFVQESMTLKNFQWGGIKGLN